MLCINSSVLRCTGTESISSKYINSSSSMQTSIVLAFFHFSLYLFFSCPSPGGPKPRARTKKSNNETYEAIKKYEPSETQYRKYKNTGLGRSRGALQGPWHKMTTSKRNSGLPLAQWMGWKTCNAIGKASAG